jgi:hypothetical protein
MCLGALGLSSVAVLAFSGRRASRRDTAAALAAALATPLVAPLAAQAETPSFCTKMLMNSHSSPQMMN